MKNFQLIVPNTHFLYLVVIEILLFQTTEWQNCYKNIVYQPWEVNSIYWFVQAYREHFECLVFILVSGGNY